MDVPGRQGLFTVTCQLGISTRGGVPCSTLRGEVWGGKVWGQPLRGQMSARPAEKRHGTRQPYRITAGSEAQQRPRQQPTWVTFTQLDPQQKPISLSPTVNRSS
ncbi:hypothetical protein DPEC_G00360550 [Dallia pectoralis]|uniref:Uncharacterized protein n=1 Tax=Dallia pectoralis TaxID=75939 RepID=A0ACC2F0V0_DALPE|nr:hypothetical protein DPEC_G00360550 [Dallia pectoralis]